MGPAPMGDRSHTNHFLSLSDGLPPVSPLKAKFNESTQSGTGTAGPAKGTFANSVPWSQVIKFRTL